MLQVTPRPASLHTQGSFAPTPKSIIHFAAQKKHIGLYPGPEAVTQFSEKLDQAGCKYSKGAIQIPYSDELPLLLISEIAAWCRDTGNHA